ncbi:hypothetical protein [Bacillus cereus]|uniref:hypothetical protein n=1 Tax=Bacillus cereus TaxID=1396 RepID=UPI003BF65DC3
MKSDKLQIYTIYPLQFLAEQIGNGYVEVENITPPGTGSTFVRSYSKDSGENRSK